MLLCALHLLLTAYQYNVDSHLFLWPFPLRWQDVPLAHRNTLRRWSFSWGCCIPTMFFFSLAFVQDLIAIGMWFVFLCFVMTPRWHVLRKEIKMIASDRIDKYFWKFACATVVVAFSKFRAEVSTISIWEERNITLSQLVALHSFFLVFHDFVILLWSSSIPYHVRYAHTNYRFDRWNHLNALDVDDIRQAVGITPDWLRLRTTQDRSIDLRTVLQQTCLVTENILPSALIDIIFRYIWDPFEHVSTQNTILSEAWVRKHLPSSINWNCVGVQLTEQYSMAHRGQRERAYLMYQFAIFLWEAIPDWYGLIEIHYSNHSAFLVVITKRLAKNANTAPFCQQFTKFRTRAYRVDDTTRPATTHRELASSDVLLHFLRGDLIAPRTPPAGATYQTRHLLPKERRPRMNLWLFQKQGKPKPVPNCKTLALTKNPTSDSD